MRKRDMNGRLSLPRGRFLQRGAPIRRQRADEFVESVGADGIYEVLEERVLN
ncbi:MAG: hypothetical protein AABM29_07985 [Actinomycetota bacterium]